MVAIYAVAESELGRLLAEALRQKAAVMPDRAYSLRDLERDSGVNYSYASKVINSDSAAPPSRNVIRSWSKALHPYLNPNEALMAAGYMPDDPLLRRTLRQIGELYSKKPPANDDAKRKGDADGNDHQ